MRKSLYLLVLASVLIAGCTSGGTTKTQNSELLRISGVTVTPGTVVAPGEIITIRMKLDNIGQEDVKFVWKNPCYKINELSNKVPEGKTESERQTACNSAKCQYNAAGLCYTYLPQKPSADASMAYCKDEFCPISNIEDPAPETSLIPLQKNSDMKNTLYDHCSNLYEIQSFTPVTSGFEGEGTQLVLKPSRSALLEWTLKAPSETTIANMQHECTFRFQINYQARAETYTYIYFANPDEKNQRTYTNKDMNLRGENVANFGPVYINFETAQDQPIKGSVDISKPDKWSKWTLYTTVRNAGDGIGKVDASTKLKIQLPNLGDKIIEALGKDVATDEIKKELLDDPACKVAGETKCKLKECPDFSISIKGSQPTIEYSATDDSRLMLYSKQSSRFSCTLPAPKVDVLEPYRFISSADYIYTIDKELKILTVPKRT